MFTGWLCRRLNQLARDSICSTSPRRRQSEEFGWLRFSGNWRVGRSYQFTTRISRRYMRMATSPAVGRSNVRHETRDAYLPALAILGGVLAVTIAVVLIGMRFMFSFYAKA